MLELRNIQYKFIINLTNFFIEKYRIGELKSLDLILTNVKVQAPYILQFVYKFDEEIWHPDKPEDYNNLIEFTIQLKGCAEYLKFRLKTKNDIEQNSILVKDYEDYINLL